MFYFKKTKKYTIYDQLINEDTLLRKPFDKTVEKEFESTMGKITIDLENWYKNEEQLVTSIFSMPFYFQQELRKKNLNVFFMKSNRDDFISFFRQNESSNAVDRFFKLIDHIYFSYPYEVLLLATRKFIINIALNEKSWNDICTTEDVLSLIEDGCYWIWILPIYQKIFMYNQLHQHIR